MRKTLLALTLGALVLGGALPGDSARTRPGRGIKVKKQALRPTRVPGDGRDVYLRVKVSGTGVAGAQVEAQAFLLGIEGPRTALESTRPGIYQGMVPVPVNATRTKVRGTITVFVTPPGANVSATRRVGVITVSPWNDSFPPPPPP